MKHFANSVQSPDIPDHPKEDQNKIGGFLSFDICDFILVAHRPESREPIMSHFYCTRCNKWFSFGSSIGNINTHLRFRHDDLW